MCITLPEARHEAVLMLLIEMRLKLGEGVLPVICCLHSVAIPAQEPN
jgi:hypothetical protein